MSRVLVDRRREEGSAVVEFVFLGVLLMIPLVYLVMMLAQLQAGAYAATIAAREAARAYVTSPTRAEASGRAEAAARISFGDFGFGEVGTVSVSCGSAPCLRPGSSVRVRSHVEVPMPLVPVFLRDVVPLTVPISAEHVLIVDRYIEAPS